MTVVTSTQNYLIMALAIIMKYYATIKYKNIID